MKTLVLFVSIAIFISFSSLARADTSKLQSVIVDISNLDWFPAKITKVEKQKDGTAILSTQLASDLVLEWETFLLPNGIDDDAFFKRYGDWQEEIDRNKFLKIAKDDYWMLWHVAGTENIVYKAFQFKSLAELRTWYAQDPDNAEGSANSRNYWKAFKIKTLNFYNANLVENKLYWMEVEEDKNPLSDEEAKEIERMERTITDLRQYGTNPLIKDVAEKMNLPAERVVYLVKLSRVTLSNGEVRYKRFISSDGRAGIIKNHGIFTIHVNCVFSTLETKESRGLLSLPIVSSPRVRIRPVMVKRKYFEENLYKTAWVCVYNKDTMTLLRVAPVVSEKSEDKKDKK